MMTPMDLNSRMTVAAGGLTLNQQLGMLTWKTAGFSATCYQHSEPEICIRAKYLSEVEFESMAETAFYVNALLEVPGNNDPSL